MQKNHKMEKISSVLKKWQEEKRSKNKNSKKTVKK